MGPSSSISQTEGLPHNCCDNCTKKCSCLPECPVEYSKQTSLHEPFDVDSHIAFHTVSQSERDELRSHLCDFRQSLLQSLTEEKPLHIGLDLVCGLPSDMVDTVVDNCEYLLDSFHVEERCLLWNHGGDVYRVTEDVLSNV